MTLPEPTDPVEQIVMTEMQKELLDEVLSQYLRKLKWFQEMNLQVQGSLTCFLPFELLKEAFEGVPPPKV
jgi:hypothetical protein